MKVFITKYALTQGILEKEVNTVNFSDTMVLCNTNHYMEHYHKPDWHESKEDAIGRANEMKHRRILSLQKMIKKLENLNFNV